MKSPIKPPHPLFAGCLILLLTSALSLGPAAPADAELVAGQMTKENFPVRHVGGPDSEGGIDDWFIGNGTLCAVISDPSHESAITPRGGVLIDLGHCQANNDQWAILQPLHNLAPSHLAPPIEIEAGVDSDRAWIRTRTVVHSVDIVTTYFVDAETPNALSISTRATRRGDGKKLFGVGTLLLHTTGQTPPFSLLRSDLTRSRGFVYPKVDRRSVLSLARGLASSDLTVLVGADEMPPISYGIERLSATLQEGDSRRPLASFSVTGLHYTVNNTLTAPLWFGAVDKKPGLMQLMQIPTMDLDSETEFATDTRIWIGQRADVASITDQIWPTASEIQGFVNDPSARIHIDLATGAPVTEIRPDADGKFSVRLPSGHYTARVVATAGRSSELDFEVTDETPNQSIPKIELAAAGSVRLPKAFIGRLLFINEDGSGPARFGQDRLGFRVGDYNVPSGIDAPYLNLANSPLDPESVDLAPGRYRVIAVRGPEYEAKETTIEIQLGQSVALELSPLLRVAETPGWISADLHVHSGESFDSSLPQTKQIIAFAASGAEVLVATEHDRIFDPRPAVAASALGDQLVSITGVEITSAFEGGDSPYSSGHLNAFPMTAARNQYRGGAPAFEGRRLRDLLTDLRALETPPFVQLNHPRPGPGEGLDDTYFSHLAVAGEPFDPTRSFADFPNSVLVEKNPTHGGRDLDFNGVELMNGGSLKRYRLIRADWFNLMLQGERILGTANSDSHRLGVVVGIPRTYVAVEKDTLSEFKEDAFMRALRSGQAYGSSGPLLNIRLDDTELGGLHSGTSGTLHVQVDAAPWVPIAEWRAYVNGELVHRAAIKAGESASLPLVFPRDAFVTVEVEGPAEGLYRDALPGFTPFAYTNPIFVDADLNGRFDASGLPSTLPTTMTDPNGPE